MPGFALCLAMQVLRSAFAKPEASPFKVRSTLLPSLGAWYSSRPLGYIDVDSGLYLVPCFGLSPLVPQKEEHQRHKNSIFKYARV